MKTKLTKLTPKQRKKLDKFIDKAEIIFFDKGAIFRKINSANNLKSKAHQDMLEADILLAEVIDELYGNDTGTDKKSK